MASRRPKTPPIGPNPVPREVQDKPKRTEKSPKAAPKNPRFCDGRTIVRAYIVDRAVDDAAIFIILGPRGQGPRARGPIGP